MILVTGASGFIGKRLIQRLGQTLGRENIIALTSTPVDGFQSVIHDDFKINIDEKEWTSKIKYIIHAASFIPKNLGENNNIELCNKSIKFLQDILYISFPSLEKFILLSSIDVYANSELISEESPLNPHSLYAHSKLYAEKMVEIRLGELKVPFQILRLGHIYGPGEEKFQKVIPITIKKILNNEPLELFGDGKELRTFIYIDDLIESIIISISLPNEIGIINIVGSKPISIKELLEKLLKISNKIIPVKNIKASNSIRNLTFDNTKFKKYFNISETNIDFGLEKEYNYFMDIYDKNI